MNQDYQSQYPSIVISATDPDLPEKLPEGFSKYSNFEVMVQSGKNTLYSCWDGIVGRTVALKILAREYSMIEEERRRFLREARITAQLQHPNTVPVYDIGRNDVGAVYFTMKKIAGENFFKVLQRLSWSDKFTERRFPMSRLIDIVLQSCHALSFAHLHGVIHRDVKPENIWVGTFGEVTLLDWGVAKVWGRGEISPSTEGPFKPGNVRGVYKEVESLTRSGQRPGTPLYMSPEQITGARVIDERTDLYSMGVVLYELLTFSEPFRGRTVEETFEQILHDEPEPPHVRAGKRKVHPLLEEITLRAIQKKPEDRYQKTSELISDLVEAQRLILGEEAEAGSSN